MPSGKNSADANAAKKKKQLVVIALLLAGLLVALWTQPSDKSDNSVVPVVKPVAFSAADSESDEAKSVFRDQMATVRKLSRLSIDSMVNAELFYVPPPQPEIIPEQEEEEPLAVAEIKVQAVYGGSFDEQSGATNHRALIGTAIIRRGEVLPDGRKIMRVTPDGVELAQ